MGRMARRQQKKSTSKLERLGGIKGKGLWIAAAGVLACVLLFNILIWMSDISELKNAHPQPTIIYDQNGEVASKISNSSIEAVRLDRVPQTMVQAVVATEDQRFFKHGGVNYFRIMNAFFKNITSGDIVAGGSTVTQQLAKNALLTHERTYTRKLKELFLAKKIERNFSKDEIMEMYLNQIYFGEGAWGIQRAAKTYFGKDVNDLTLSESAMLAGLIKSPTRLSPFKNMEESVQRRDIVLSLMLSEGYINLNDLEAAKTQLIVLEGKKVRDDYSGKYPFYIDHIISEAIQKYNLTQNEILSGGLHIYTELNPIVQKATEEVYKTGGEYFPGGGSNQSVQSGAIFINSSTGGISALVGGRGEHTFLGFNRATQLVRQPGSTMKPLAVYTPALENGYDIYDRLEDRPLNINGYQPNNYDRKFRGEVTMFDALVYSYNVPPVWLLNQLGVEYGTNALERFGIPLHEDDQSLSIALGGMTEGTSPLRMAQAFSAFPNNGVMMEAHAIQRIEDSNGETLANWKGNAVRVTEPEVAQKITYMLKGVVDRGTGSNANISDIELAGKTGTTELPFATNGGAKDHWFVGYTPELVGAVWVGFDKTDEKNYLTTSSGATATVIFRNIIEGSASELSRKSFDFSAIGKAVKKAEETEKKRKKKKDEEEQENEKERKEEEREREKERREEEKERQKERKEKEKERKKGKKDDDDDDD